MIAAVAGVIAVRSGLQLETQRQLQSLPELAVHAHRGRILRWVLLAFLVRGGARCLAARRSRRRWPRAAAAARAVPVPWPITLQVLLVAGAVAVLVCVFLTGDSGARTLWG